MIICTAMIIVDNINHFGWISVVSIYSIEKIEENLNIVSFLPLIHSICKIEQLMFSCVVLKVSPTLEDILFWLFLKCKNIFDYLVNIFVIFAAVGIIKTFNKFDLFLNFLASKYITVINVRFSFLQIFHHIEWAQVSSLDQPSVQLQNY